MKIIVIGAGPGGMAAALKAVELGAEVTIVENKKLGGVCLNEGCIPMKRLLTYGRKLQEAKEFLGEVTRSRRPDWADWFEAQKAKKAIINELSKPLNVLLGANGIEVIYGSAYLLNSHTISIRSAEGEKVLQADKVIIAAGSRPKTLKNIDAIDTTSALELETVPQSINIIGGGVSGLEFATFFNLFGTEVSIIEQEATLLPGFDEMIVRRITSYLVLSGIKVVCGARDLSAAPRAEKTLLCIGRNPNSESLGLANTGVKTDDKGFIIVNEKMETNIAGIYAVGDVNGKTFLASPAEKEGRIAAKNAVGQEAIMDYSNIPRVIGTMPQIAGVGITERRARALGIQTKITQSWFKANPMAHIRGETEGFRQIVRDKSTGKILGVQIIGAEAGELIHIYSGNNFFHPSLAEIFKDEV